MSNFKSLIRPGGLAIMALLGLGFSPAAWSATPAGTDISNTVTLDYDVGTVAQTQLSDTVTFEVDRLLNIEVSAVAANVDVTPGESDAVRAFDVTNLGNETQDVSLTVADAAGDDFDEATVIWIDEGDLGFDSGTDANQAYIDGLAPGVTVRVFVVSDIGLGNADGNVDGASLVAQVAESAGTPGTDITSDDAGIADNVAGIDDVFGDLAGTATGDDANDGVHSDVVEFTVVSAALALTKTSQVVDDGIAGTTTNLKRIPGATVRYFLTVENTGSAAAANLQLSDTFDTNTAFVPGSLALDTTGDLVCAEDTFTDNDDDDGGDFDGTDTVDFQYASLGAGSTVTFCVDVTIN